MPSYTVQKGDTLSGIAQKVGLGSNWKALGYTGDPRKLSVGTVLNYGGGSSSSSAPAPSSSGGASSDVTSALDQFQSSQLQNELAIPSMISNEQSVATGAQNNLNQLAPLDVTALRTSLNTQYSVSDKQALVDSLTKEYENEVTNGGGVAQVVGAGRASVLSQALKVAQTDLTNTNKVIDSMIKDSETTYNDATKQYEKEFSEAMSMMKEGDSELSKAQASAKANLTVLANNITKGSLNWSDLSPDQQNTINMMEIQSGLGVGFIASLHHSMTAAEVYGPTPTYKELHGGGTGSGVSPESTGSKGADALMSQMQQLPGSGQQFDLSQYGGPSNASREQAATFISGKYGVSRTTILNSLYKQFPDGSSSGSSSAAAPAGVGSSSGSSSSFWSGLLSKL